MNIPIKLLSPKAKIPTRGSKCAAGLDLYAVENTYVFAHSVTGVKTDIAIKIPDGYYGRIAPRSGLALKHGIDVFGGVLDSDFSGEIKVILYNSGKYNYYIKEGDRIAQLIIEKYYDFPFAVVDDLGETERGQTGFGASGV